nr:MAG TPA: hypothetical protein [Caudoviricetes sp.]
MYLHQKCFRLLENLRWCYRCIRSWHKQISYSNCYLWYSNHYTIEEKEKNQLINTKINYKSHKFENSGSARVLFIYKKLFF